MVALHTHNLALAGVPAAVALDGRGAAPRGVGVLLVGNCQRRGGKGLLAFGARLGVTELGLVAVGQLWDIRQETAPSDSEMGAQPCLDLGFSCPTRETGRSAIPNSVQGTLHGQPGLPAALLSPQQLQDTARTSPGGC